MVKSKAKPIISAPQEAVTVLGGSKGKFEDKGVTATAGNGISGNLAGNNTNTMNGNKSEDIEGKKGPKPKAPPKPNKKPERRFKPSSNHSGDMRDSESEAAQQRLLDNVDLDPDQDHDHGSDLDTSSTKLFPTRNHHNHGSVNHNPPHLMNVQRQVPIIVNNSTLPRGSPSPYGNHPNEVIYHGPGSVVSGGGTLPLPNTLRPTLRNNNNVVGTYSRAGTLPLNGHGHGNGVIYALNSNGTLTPLQRNVGGMTLPQPYPTRHPQNNQTRTATITITTTNGNGPSPGPGFNETAVALNQQRQNGQASKQQQQPGGPAGTSRTGHASPSSSDYQRLHRVGLIRAKARTDSYKVIAFICGFFAAILLVMGLASSEWLLASGYRQGLFVYCVAKNETETNVPFVSRPEQATEGCHRIDLNIQAYTLVAAAFCVVSLLVDVFATLLTVLGLRCRDPNKKYKYYRIAVYVMALALVAVLVALVVYPVCFARIMEGSKRPFWEFGWAYGVGWGASIFLFGGVILLLCDKESEEIYYKERTIVQYADTNNKA